MFLKDSITLAFSHTGFVHKRSVAHIYGIYFILMPVTVLTYHTLCFHVGKTDPVPDTKGILSIFSVLFMVAVDDLILLEGHDGSIPGKISYSYFISTQRFVF